MKVSSLAAAIAVFGLALAPMATPAAQPLKMTATFLPKPLRVGTETVTVSLTDGAHKPVSGAYVTADVK